MATTIRRARKIEIEKLRIWSMLHRARSAWPKRKEKNESSATCRKGGEWKVSVSKVIRATDSLHPRYRAHLFFTRAPRAKFFRRSNSRERGSTAKRSARWTLIRWGRKGEGVGARYQRRAAARGFNETAIKGGPLLFRLRQPRFQNNKLSSFATWTAFES